MMPRNADYLRQQQERAQARWMRVVVAIVGLFWLAIAVGIVWLVRHP